MSTKKAWSSIDLTDAEFNLFFGWRPRPRRLLAAQVTCDKALRAKFGEIAQSTLVQLSGADEVAFSPYAALEAFGEEYLSLPLPLHATDEVTSEESATVSNLLEVIEAIDRDAGIDFETAQELQEKDHLFYAFSYKTKGPSAERITFVRQQDPTRIARQASLFSRSADGLVLSEKPDFAFSQSVCMVVVADQIAIMNRTSFDRLFNDLETVKRAVPTDALKLQSNLPAGLPIDNAAIVNIMIHCDTKVSQARRLHRLAETASFGSLNTANLKAALTQHGENIADYFNASNVLKFDVTKVESFFDLLEERWWTSDFTGEKRRADAFRKR